MRFLDDLADVNRAIRTLFDAKIKPHGLTLARARLLKHLSRGGEGSRQTELATALNVELPSIVTLVDGLEKSGLVERRPIQGDRRARGIFLTKAALKEVEAIIGFANEIRDLVLSDVKDEDLLIAARVMQQLAENVKGSAT